MPTRFPTVLFNAREEALSSDLTRVGALASKSQQDELLNSSIDGSGVAISSFTRVPTITPVAATFTANISDGEAVAFDGSIFDPDASKMQVIGIAPQTLVFAIPDGANGRIDLVCAAPAMVNGDNSVRNILQDPSSRAFAPQTVPKTTAPVASLTIVAGTPATSPVPPATPVGSVAVFEVYVPPSASSSAEFGFIPRLPRMSAHPFVSDPTSAVLRGCHPIVKIVAGVGVWTELLEDSNAVCINGEVWTFAKAGVIAAQDTITPAFSTPAPASNDVPVYVYACGGRALPQAGSSTSPILLIESATPPDLATGRPSAALGTPRGNTTSACFIGCVWKRKNTTTRQKTRQVGEWAYYDQDSFSFEVGAGAAASADITLPSAPAYKEAGADSQAGCVRMLVRISHSVACTVTLRPKSGVMPMYEVFTDAPSGAVALDWGAVAEVPYDATGPQISIGIGAATAVTLRPIAYRVPVRRFAR